MDSLDDVKAVLSSTPDLRFAVLVGSRADGTAHAQSDWDIAVAWAPSDDWMTIIGAHEVLRREIARALGVAEDRIDLIDLARASLAMRANVAENGKVLMGEDGLHWKRLLSRTWRELEYFYWEREHASLDIAQR
ncbi:MAG: nucleotidyltransferase domain-containing protein [Propionivibrio sp.]